MSTVTVIEHVACEKPGIIEEILENRGIKPRTIHTYQGQPVPKDMAGLAGLIVMGGPMGVYEVEHYPFLRDEMRLIERALKDQKPVLGVCLGSQLLAAALGAAVTKGKQKEIGWYPITLTPVSEEDPLWTGIERAFVACHWHGDVFELPRGAISMASSNLTACQAFRYGRNAYANLFHMETTAEILQGMVEAFPEELKEAGVDDGDIVRQSAEHLPRLHKIAKAVFSRWVDLLEA
jgi:GMP synthase (glutamine-hydrolysing)